MRLCTAHHDLFKPALLAGTTSWFDGMVALSADALFNGRPRGY